jgi:FkbM family methyltransferase
MSKNTLADLIKSGYKIEHYNYAVSNMDGEIKINCSLSPEGDNFTNQGSNILESPPTIDKWYGGVFKYAEEITYVKTINFSEFLKNKISNDDFVLVKMDIEGSEFSVLDSLIETGSFKLINEIYIEFHERFFDDMDYYVNKKNNYKKIFSENNIILNEWI